MVGPCRCFTLNDDPSLSLAGLRQPQRCPMDAVLTATMTHRCRCPAATNSNHGPSLSSALGQLLHIPRNIGKVGGRGGQAQDRDRVRGFVDGRVCLLDQNSLQQKGTHGPEMLYLQQRRAIVGSRWPEGMA